MISLKLPSTPEEEREWKNHSLGNNMFQYATIRTVAERLKTDFYFPEWKGDRIFDLTDGKIRAKNPKNLGEVYVENNDDLGSPAEMKKIKDNTEISGNFQGEIFFDAKKVRKWFSFKEKLFGEVRAKYKDINFSRCVGMHLRLGDMRFIPQYYQASPGYYLDGLEKVKNKEKILVFSDEPELARMYLRKMNKIYGERIIYIRGNGVTEDLYLMSKCHDFICSLSTLSWWGAFLNSTKDKIIIMPREGAFRKGYKKRKFNYFWLEGSIKIPALRRGLLDSYWFKKLALLPGKAFRTVFGKKVNEMVFG